MAERVFVISFCSAATAECSVAGVPAVARALQALAQAAGGNGDGLQCILLAGEGWAASAHCRGEAKRLAPPGALLRFAAEECGSDPGPLPGHAAFFCGEALAGALGQDAARPAAARRADLAGAMAPRAAEPALLAGLSRAGRAILAATGKPGDGIVSRHINRPISRAITARLLHIRGIRPVHASFGTALLGIAMVAALLAGGAPGLVWGGLLFQAASIFDGVDGEIARATSRSSPAGARLDSLIDAACNLAFVGGVALNLGLRGDLVAASAGAFGLGALGIGLWLIGQRASRLGQPINFDVIKGHVRREGSRLRAWLVWLTMRDFIALAAALALVLGLAHGALLVFSAAALAWLAVTLAILWRTPVACKEA